MILPVIELFKLQLLHYEGILSGTKSNFEFTEKLNSDKYSMPHYAKFHI